jgi:hypothetical protein
MRRADNRVAQVDVFQDVNLKIREHIKPIGPELLDGFNSVHHFWHIGSMLQVSPFDVWRVRRRYCCQVACIRCGIDLPENLDVFLRHRSGIISKK